MSFKAGRKKNLRWNTFWWLCSFYIILTFLYIAIDIVLQPNQYHPKQYLGISYALWNFNKCTDLNYCNTWMVYIKKSQEKGNMKIALYYPLWTLLYVLRFQYCSNILECNFHHVYQLWTKFSTIRVILWWILIFDVIWKWPFPLGSFLVGDFQYWSNISITKVRS